MKLCDLRQAQLADRLVEIDFEAAIKELAAAREKLFGKRRF